MGGVYVFSCPDRPGFVKVGRASDLGERMRAHQTAHHVPLTVERWWPVGDPRGVERAMHEVLVSCRVRVAGGGSEWFRCGLDRVDAAARVVGLGGGRLLAAKWWGRVRVRVWVWGVRAGWVGVGVVVGLVVGAL